MKALDQIINAEARSRETRVISLRVPQAMIDEINELNDKEGYGGKSYTIRGLIRLGIDTHKQQGDDE